VEAQVHTLDADGISAGMAVTVGFPGLPQRFLTPLTGSLVHISADRFIDERSGAPYFKARVILDRESLELLPSRRIVPGIPAEVVISTGSRTALRYLLDPVLGAVGHAMRER
jgi:hypothetical protein